MMYRCSRETLTIAFLLLSAAFPLICAQTVSGIEGQSVTLPCFYNVKKISDITSMCWGRGSCPNSKCNEVLIWTDGYQVTHQSSDRYQLNDIIARGKISLTISQASMSDAGTYCCRIEHHGWFNDERKNIRLDMEKAPPTTPPTTTRRTTPQRTRPPIRKTTRPPTTAKATTPSVTSVKATTLLPITKIISTPPPTPARTTIAVPTSEETMEMTTVPTAERTTTPQPTPTAFTSAPAVLTTVSSPPLSSLPYTTPIDEATTEAQPLSTEPFVICNFSEEMIHPHEAFDHHNPRNTLPSQPAPNSSEDGNSDLFSGNMETMEKKESSLTLHMIITAVCISLIVIVVVFLLILKFRGKERGRYLFGFDPNLELVSNAEAPLSETDAEISQTVTLEVDKVEADKPTL
ncbi:hepatitis A virus cellular receptor 1 homolog [Rana temporaria]|uniref:hepatitis A virus cellular receptor 1 homolog n=1 Tax=Rana temporaria TaxID=8407 RepID=UPI001AAE070F|nr:hepatitis A virus cellular receptor 1 homolog [Rana temporaria]